jgi:hypothetical protein
VTEKKLMVVSESNRSYIKGQIDLLEIGDQVRVGPPDRLLAQNAKLHAMCGDIARQAKHCGRELSLGQWKILMVSAHAIESGEEADMVPGLTGEYVNLRESTALMSIRRMASLIESVEAWGAHNGVKFRERHF